MKRVMFIFFILFHSSIIKTQMEGSIIYGLSATLPFAQYDKILDFVFSDYEK